MEVLPAIIEASVKPLEKIDGIKIVQVDGLNRGASGGGDGPSGSSGGGNLAEQAVAAALAYRAQQPILDAVLGEIGMKGGDLNGLVEAVRKDIAPAAGNGADRNVRNTPPANIVTPGTLPGNTSTQCQP